MKRNDAACIHRRLSAQVPQGFLLKYRDYLRGNPHFDRDIYVPRWLCAIGDSPATFFQIGVARRAAALSQMIAKRG
jgi:hypothetical protein